MKKKLKRYRGLVRGGRSVIDQIEVGARRSKSLAKISGGDFDGDFAAEFFVPGAVDFSHAADSEKRQDLVGTQTSP